MLFGLVRGLTFWLIILSGQLSSFDYNHPSRGRRAHQVYEQLPIYEEPPSYRPPAYAN